MNKFSLFVVVGLATLALIGCEQKSPAEKSMGDAVKSIDQAASDVTDAAKAVQAEAEQAAPVVE